MVDDLLDQVAMNAVERLAAILSDIIVNPPISAPSLGTAESI
jgi:hypothetical protein